MSPLSLTLYQGKTVSPFQSILLTGEKGIPLSRCKLVIIVCDLVTRVTTGTAAAHPPGTQIKKPLPKSVTNRKTALEASLQASLSIWLHFVTLNPVKVSALNCLGKLSEIGVTKCNQRLAKWH